MHITIKSIPYFIPSNSSPSPNTHFPSQVHVLFMLSPLNPPIPACTCMGIDSSSGSWAAQGPQPWKDLTLPPPPAISSLSWCWNFMTTTPMHARILSGLSCACSPITVSWCEQWPHHVQRTPFCCNQPLPLVFTIGLHLPWWSLSLGMRVCICLKSVIYSYIFNLNLT